MSIRFRKFLTAEEDHLVIEAHDGRRSVSWPDAMLALRAAPRREAFTGRPHSHRTALAVSVLSRTEQPREMTPRARRMATVEFPAYSHYRRHSLPSLWKLCPNTFPNLSGGGRRNWKRRERCSPVRRRRIMMMEI